MLGTNYLRIRSIVTPSLPGPLCPSLIMSRYIQNSTTPELDETNLPKPHLILHPHQIPALPPILLPQRPLFRPISPMARIRRPSASAVRAPVRTRTSRSVSSLATAPDSIIVPSRKLLHLALVRKGCIVPRRPGRAGRRGAAGGIISTMGCGRWRRGGGAASADGGGVAVGAGHHGWVAVACLVEHHLAAGYGCKVLLVGLGAAGRLVSLVRLWMIVDGSELTHKWDLCQRQGRDACYHACACASRVPQRRGPQRLRSRR